MVFKGEVEFDMEPPENFDPKDPYGDPIAFIEMRNWIVREKFIGIERAKILRERVKWCYRREGVNHMKYCRKWAEAYLVAAQNAGWGRRSADLKYSYPYKPKAWEAKEENKSMDA